MANKISPQAPVSGGPGGNRPRFRFVTLWRPSTLAIGGLIVGGFGAVGVAALNLSQAQTEKGKNVARELRVMPLGDTVTDGGPVYAGSYRAMLWQKLVVQDGFKLDYVGSQSGGDGSLPDKDHEGHVGWNIDQLTQSVPGWLASYDPDIVLLQAGASDLEQGVSATVAIQRLDAMLAAMTTVQTDTRIMLSSLPPLKIAGTWNGPAWQSYNAALPDVAGKYRAKGYDVSFVDVAVKSGIATGQPDMADDRYPSVGGYAKIAEAWYGPVRGQFE